MKIRFIILFVLLTLQIFIVSFKGMKADNCLTTGFSQLLLSDTVVVGSGIKVDTFNLSILPPSSGVQFFREGIVYLSSSKLERKMPENHVSFGKPDSRYALINYDSIENIRPFSVDKTFNFPIDAVTFSSDYNTMYFTGYSKKDRAEKIYKAECTQGNKDHWTFSDVPLSFCDTSDYTHPALSEDGEILIFASNRQGSAGGMDLFMSQNNGGDWSEPVNLGSQVNTSSNELYPYLDTENNLYFSSDKKEGYGGYDIYVCKYSGTRWEKPENISTPVNTESDDVAFTINRKDGKSGFFTTRQKKGKDSPKLCRIELSGSSSDNAQTLSQYFTRGSSYLASSAEPEKPDEQAITVSDTVVSLTIDETPAKAEEATTPVTENLKKEKEIAKKANVSVVSASAVPVSSVKAEQKKEGVVYRIQILSNVKSKGSYKITIDGKTYDTYEYQYSGSYRTTVGEFRSLSEAGRFQGTVRKSGFPQGFVVAFKDGVRSTDPALFR